MPGSALQAAPLPLLMGGKGPSPARVVGRWTGRACPSSGGRCATSSLALLVLPALGGCRPRRVDLACQRGHLSIGPRAEGAPRTSPRSDSSLTARVAHWSLWAFPAPSSPARAIGRSPALAFFCSLPPSRRRPASRRPPAARGCGLRGRPRPSALQWRRSRLRLLGAVAGASPRLRGRPVPPTGGEAQPHLRSCFPFGRQGRDRDGTDGGGI